MINQDLQNQDLPQEESSQFTPQDPILTAFEQFKQEPQIPLDGEQKDPNLKAAYDAIKINTLQDLKTIYSDDKGNTYDDIPDEQLRAYDQAQLDPPTEEEKQKKKSEIEQRRQEYVQHVTEEVNTQNPNMKQFRRQRLIDKKVKENNDLLDKEYDDFLKEKVVEEIKTPTVVKKSKNKLISDEAALQKELTKLDNMMRGIRTDNIAETVAAPEGRGKALDGSFEVTRQKFTNYNDFRQNAKPGDVWKVYVHKSGVGMASEQQYEGSVPKYYEAVQDNEGNTLIQEAQTTIPLKQMNEVIVPVEYVDIACYNERVDNLELQFKSGTISKEKYQERKTRLNESRNKSLKRNLDAYDRIISNPEISQETKLAVIASVFPNEFQKKYAEYKSEAGVSDEDALDRVVKAGLGIVLSPALVIGKAAGALEKGGTSLSMAIQGKEYQQLPMGTLAMEIEDNPELITYMDKVIKEAGSDARVYLSSVSGLAQLVDAAKILMKNKEVNSIISSGKDILQQTQVVFTEYNNIVGSLNIEVQRQRAAVTTIQNKSGYTAAYNDYLTLYKDIENNQSPEIRDAFRFLKIRAFLMANGEEGISDQMKLLSKDDSDFLNANVVRFTNPSSNGVMKTVNEKLNKLNQAADFAKSKYPGKEIEAFVTENKPALDAKIAAFVNAKNTFLNSSIFTPEGKKYLGGIQNIENSYVGSSNDTYSYTFPTLSQQQQVGRNGLIYLNPAYTFGINVLNGLTGIMGDIKESMGQITGFVYDKDTEFTRNIAYSLNEFERIGNIQLENTGNYLSDIFGDIGAALPQLAGFAFSVLGGGPAGGIAYLGATMTGRSMREASEAGLSGVGQILYTGLTIGIEWGSELISPEANLFRTSGVKSTLTKELVEQIMSPKTRAKAMKEWSQRLFKRMAEYGYQGTLETVEEQVSEKANYIIQSIYNSTVNTSFNPTVSSIGQSVDQLLTMIGTTAIFKGGIQLSANVSKMAQAPTVQERIKKGLIKEGYDKPTSMVMASLTTNQGLSTAIDLVNKIESGQIQMAEVNEGLYTLMRDHLIPVAISQSATLSADPNMTIQQKVAIIGNMAQVQRINEMVENGQISAESVKDILETHQKNAERAIEDSDFANSEFGITNKELSTMIQDYFGIAETIDKFRQDLTSQAGQPSAAMRMSMPPLDRQGLIREMEAIFVQGEVSDTLAKTNKAEIEKDPSAFLLGAIQSSKSVLEVLKLNYENVSKTSTAAAELAKIDDLNKNIAALEELRDRYVKSSGVEVTPITEDRTVFTEQAELAIDNLKTISTQTKKPNQYIDRMVEGATPTAVMDELASQVIIDEPAVFEAIGADAVNRVKQYIQESGFKTNMPVRRTWKDVESQKKLNESRSALMDAIGRANEAFAPAQKSAMNDLIARMKKVFPGVNVVNDKKGFDDAMQDEAARSITTKGGIIYGRVKGGVVYLNPDFSNFNTAIHEFGHLWLNVVKVVRPDIYDRGRSLIRDSEYMAKVSSDPMYDGLTQDEMENEALAMAIGDRGEQIVNEVRRQGVKRWIRRLIAKVGQYMGVFNLSKVELDSMDLDMFLNMANASLFEGKAITKSAIQESQSQFQASSLSRQARNYAYDLMGYYLDNGMTLDQAYIATRSDVSVMVISNSTGKGTSDQIAQDIESGVKDAFERRKAEQEQQQRDNKLNEAYMNQGVRDIMDNARQQAQRIKDNDHKVSKTDAYETILNNVKQSITKLYESGEPPKGITWANMMRLAAPIANDAMLEAFPSAKGEVMYDNKTVTMKVSDVIRGAIAQQITAIKDINTRAKAIKAIVDDVLNTLTKKYGSRKYFTSSDVKKITSLIEENVFTRADITESVARTSVEVAKIIEKRVKAAVLSDTKSLLEKLNDRIKGAKYVSQFVEKMGGLVADRVESLNEKIERIQNSSASVEDIFDLNTLVKRIINNDLNAIEDAAALIGLMDDVAQEKIKDEYKSLLTKIKTTIKDAQNTNLALSTYENLKSIQAAVNDIKERRGNISLLPAAEQAEILAQYGQLMLTDFSNIDRYVEQAANSIRISLFGKIQSINRSLVDESSNIRYVIRNQFSYEQFLQMTRLLTDDYISSLTPEDMIELSNVLDSIVVFGNYNHTAYRQYVKAMAFDMKMKNMDWGNGVATRRNKMNTMGATGFFFKRMKNVIREFTDPEGGSRSSDVLANNLDLLKFHAMDAELFNGFDELNMGFLEREVFGPMSAAMDAANTKSVARLEDLRQAMISLSDKSNYSVIKTAFADLWKTYGVGQSKTMAFVRAILKGGSASSFYNAVSTRMATIIAIQLDHISNNPERLDMDVVLERNIIKGLAEGRTMYDYLTSPSISPNSEVSGYEALLDIVAYAALTNGGRNSLSGMLESDLLRLLTPKQREGVNMWRQHIANNQELLENAQVITGEMNFLRKNYFPRRVMSDETVESIGDPQEYLMQQNNRVGFDKTQLKGRQEGASQKIDLDGNRVLFKNMNSLYLLSEIKPFLDKIKGITDAIETLKQNSDNPYAYIYVEAISKSLTDRLKASLLSNNKAVNENFGIVERGIMKMQSFAAKMWLLSFMRQIRDFASNLPKLASAIVFENRKMVGNQTFRSLKFWKSEYKTKDGVMRTWNDYVEVAKDTGSSVYKIMSMYADNFLADYKKSPEQLQRENLVGSWQDMIFKKNGWMARFESAFERISGQPFDHDAYKDKRGAYYAMNRAFVHDASAAADSFIDKQFGLPSQGRKPIRRQPFIPVITRGLRNVFRMRGKTASISSDSIVGSITGFMQGYLTTQYQAHTSYMKLAFSTTSGLSLGKRVEYFTRAFLENVLPTVIYALFRSLQSTLFATAAAAAYGTIDDPEEAIAEQERLSKEAYWDRWKKKVQMARKAKGEEASSVLINAYSSVIIDPQTGWFLRNAASFAMFLFWKQTQVESLLETKSKEERRVIKEKIRRTERFMSSAFGINPIEIYGGRRYEEAIWLFYEPGELTKGWEEFMGSVSGYSALTSVIASGIVLYDLNNASPKAGLNNDETIASAGLQLYGIIFANMIIGGKLAPILGMMSGDARKFGETILKDQLKQLQRFEKENAPFRKIVIGKDEKKKKSRSRSRSTSSRSRSKNR